MAAEKAYAELEQQCKPAVNGVIFDTAQREEQADEDLVTEGVLGAKTTGLEAKATLRMTSVPTAFYHLFAPESHPLLSTHIHNVSNKIRRVRVSSCIEGYSATAVNSFEMEPNSERQCDQLPALFPQLIKNVYELTRAMLHVTVDDLESNKIEIDNSYPIWLLARTTAPLAVKDPLSNQWLDLTPYLAAFVTPNDPEITKFLRTVADYHPQKRLVGYQKNEQDVEDQIKAIFYALQKETRITYVNSAIDFTPDQLANNRRVRLPRESLQDRVADCMDGTLLMASLIEAISLTPAIVIVPGYTLLGWASKKDGSAPWRYIETTKIAAATFDEACAEGEELAGRYKELMQSSGNPMLFRQHAISTLRTDKKITPMA